MASLRHERDQATAALRVAEEEANALRRSEQRLDLMLESATEYAIFTLDLKGRITSWNTGARNILGWEKQEILGRDAGVIFTPEDRADDVPESERVQALNQGRASDERWHVRRDGSRFWATGTLMPLRNGGVEGFLKILRDRTEERRAGDERESLRLRLEAEQAIFKAVVERLPSGLVVSEAPSGRHLIYNDQAARLLGHELADIGDYPEYAQYGALHPDGTPYRAEEYPLVRTLIRGEVVDQEEMIYRRADGRVTTLSVSTAPVRGPDGRITLGITTFHDIAERKALEEALRSAKEQADRANQAKSRFLAAASHDLRQPLQSLLLFVSVLRNHVSGDRGAATLAHLQRGLDAMRDLLDSLMDISRLDAGIIEAHVEDFPVQPLLDEIGAAFTPIAAAKGVELKVAACGAVVRSDRTLLGRMVRNLVENAVRYTGSGHISVACRQGDGRLRIAIEDTGIGIPPGDLDRIWEEFQQVGNLERNRTQGLGMGLAIVQRLSQLLGHPVGVRSDPGAGSVFSIDVPLGPAGAPVPQPVPSPAGNDRGRLVVLVDDDELVLEALEETLTSWGFAVLAANSMDSVMERLRVTRRRPDVVLTDYQLGGGQFGTDVVLAVREMFDADVRGAILTGETRPDQVRDAVGHGLEIIHKPVTPQKLDAVLQKLLM
ncbi:PAS domain S-box protein (plasmid) [Skermanella rosea]|uniref:PAS domain-containing hybrid sensor histidine kinase/response regulator n=1 Tax=Skermanella rosea TaxID=1817965 RepID=UPI0019335D65|nr:PAS domain S-box protein [Skermanella rosea]UEM07474.1 PAS domain S-box protein [Skermanella rosea]